MSGAVDASVDSFFGESPRESVLSEVEKSRKSSYDSDSTDDENSHASTCFSSAEEEEEEEKEKTSSIRAASEDDGNSTARSHSSSASSSYSEDVVEVETPKPHVEVINSVGDTQQSKKDNDDNSEEEIKSVTLESDKKEDQMTNDTANQAAGDSKPSRKGSESEGELTDVSPMATPRPSAAPEAPTTGVSVTALYEDENMQSEEVPDIKVSVQSRPKSAHPRSRGRNESNNSVNSSTSSTYDYSNLKNQSEIRKHRDRLLYSTSRSTKDLNHLLEAVLVLDQKVVDREQAKDPNPFPERAVGSSRGPRKTSFQTSERQREIQKENERLLRELTKQKRRPMSAHSTTSGRSSASNYSMRSGLSTASAIEFRKTVNCRTAPIARNYHTKINRTKEEKRINEENLALLRRLQNVRASPTIQMSRQQVARPPQRTRPKSMRPKIVNTWTDGW